MMIIIIIIIGIVTRARACNSSEKFVGNERKGKELRAHLKIRSARPTGFYYQASSIPVFLFTRKFELFRRFLNNLEFEGGGIGIRKIEVIVE